MLTLKGQGELKLLKLNKDVRGETMVKTVLARLVLTAVPVDVVAQGFVSQLALFYSKDDDLKIGDLDYLPVSRHVANVTAVFSGKQVDAVPVTIEQSIVDRVRLYPRAGRIVDVTLDVKGDIVTGLDALHDLLKTTVVVELEEHEFQVQEEEEQKEAA